MTSATWSAIAPPLVVAVAALALALTLRRRGLGSRPVARAIVIAMLTSLTVLGVLEAGLRMQAASAPVMNLPDPVLIWRLNPGVSRRVDGWSYYINSQGFRGDELSPASAGSGVRVGVVGDSALFGHGVNDDRCFCAGLQKVLRRRTGRSDVEVVNLAVPGWTSFQSAQHLREVGDGLDLDLVVAGFNNGPESSDMTERERSHIDSPVVGLYRLLYHCQLYLTLRSGLQQGRIYPTPGGPQTPRVPPEEHLTYLRDIRGFCLERGIPVVFMVMPLNPAPGRKAPRAPFYRSVVREAAAGATLLDFHALWKGSRTADDFLPLDIVHLSVRGNQRMAIDVADAILPLLRLTTAPSTSPR